MKTRIQTKEEFKQGKLVKQEFINEMYLLHQVLFDYVELLKKADIASIEIKEDAVYFTSKKAGVKLVCTVADKRAAPFEIMNFEEYEAGDAALMYKLIKDGDTIFDIGANIGWYSISLSKLFPASAIYSFEPLATTFNNLKRNVELNAADNIKVHNFGFSNRNDVLTFYSSPHTSVSNSAENITDDVDAIAVTCQVQPLDEFIATNSTGIDFIKCDVEGAELYVFEGAKQTLEKHKPVVFTEMLRKWSAKFGYHPNDIIQLFAALNYRCFYGKGENFFPISEITNETVSTNFFFLHVQKHKELIKQYVISN